jgi:hypothetical protein
VDGRRDLDGRSDIYSVGLVAWEMATGRQPWAGETLYNVVYKQKHEELPSLAELCPEMPHYFRKAIEGALKKNPGERWRDAGELLAALTNPYAHLSHPKPQPSSPTPQHSDPTPSRGEQAPPRSEPTPEPTPARAAEPAEALGMEDADTLVITRQDVERSWARSPARENGPARPEEKAATDAARRRTESRPAAESRPGENRPGVDNRAVAEAGPAPQGGRVAPKAAPGAPAPPSPAAAKPAAQPPIPPKPALDPSKMPRWLVAVEEGTVSNGPWALDYGPNPPRRNRPLIVVGVLLVLVAAAIAGVIAYF